MMFHVRAERNDGTHFDCEVGGRNLAEVRAAFERDREHLAPFEWHGAVVFCDGSRPTELLDRWPSRRRAA